MSLLNIVHEKIYSSKVGELAQPLLEYAIEYKTTGMHYAGDPDKRSTYKYKEGFAASGLKLISVKLTIFIDILQIT